MVRLDKKRCPIEEKTLRGDHSAGERTAAERKMSQKATRRRRRISQTGFVLAYEEQLNLCKMTGA